ncbi:lytic transglycosylase domain-containing protein [Micromonospora rhizosphaerae]|uniref:lytic transglycosylase domain-containing protein n=1 Tax=Micromonospora rhizosphaerae TaxID=568872 RepID=UPI000B82FBD8|nr:lytic transglycosylase domain-containing protein [Micromonospora rhizosphaerae]
MVDGEDRSRVRPLRPAAPPDGSALPPSPPLPRPRGETADSPADKVDKPVGAARAADKVDKTAAAPKADGGGTTDSVAGPKADDGGTTDGIAPKAEPAEPEPTGKAATRRRRMPPPRQLAVGAARATRAWSRRPSGRAALPGVFLLGLVAATAAAGALLVPATARQPKPVAVDATATSTGVPQGGVLPGATGGVVPPGLPGATGLPGTAPPTGTAQPTGPVGGPAPTGRPADALAGWAQQVSARTGIPLVAMQAYGYAELVLAETHRSCQLSWTTLAAIGYVESRHGAANGATLKSTGRAEPEIIGDRLDGQGGRSRILDTDRGQLDRDTVYDRAIGPMQFIPSTWREIGADADNDGVKDPHDIDDAALAAGEYLCKAGRNMTIPGDWWGAILSYNDVRRYAQDVFDKADEYGRLSRT